MLPNDRRRQGGTKRKKAKKEIDDNITPTDINSGGRTATKQKMDWRWWWPLPTTTRSKSIDHRTKRDRTIQIDNQRRGLDPSRLPPLSYSTVPCDGQACLTRRRHSKPSSACPSAHNHPHHHRHHHQQLVIITLFVALILGQQATTTMAMLDALKALFILTGASTYLGKF